MRVQQCTLPFPSCAGADRAILAIRESVVKMSVLKCILIQTSGRARSAKTGRGSESVVE